jgi:hypothetical protein
VVTVRQLAEALQLPASAFGLAGPEGMATERTDPTPSRGSASPPWVEDDVDR